MTVASLDWTTRTRTKQDEYLATSQKRSDGITSTSSLKNSAPCCQVTPAKWTNPPFCRRASTSCRNNTKSPPSPSRRRSSKTGNRRFLATKSSRNSCWRHWTASSSPSRPTGTSSTPRRASLRCWSTSLEEHSDVSNLLSSHIPEEKTLTPEYLTKNQLEFCCHMLRGAMDPKEPAVYEHVKFIGNFKSVNNIPDCPQNGFAKDAIKQTLHLDFEEQFCLIATVKLVKPKFIKEMCTVEEPSEEFTSRQSLEWKFLFLDHRAPPIIGYLPFEVLGTSGYDYYHVDDLDTLAKCHEHLMQYGKGKSCFYRFLTKGQQWIWLQTHYYITYHQWNSRPEFIVCTHTVVSYGDVRSEQRQEFGLKESSTDKVSAALIWVGIPFSMADTFPLAFRQSRDSGLESQPNASSPKEALEFLGDSGTVSPSSHGSRKSSYTPLSEASSSRAKLQGDRSTPAQQPVSQIRSSIGSQSVSSKTTVTEALMVSQQQPQEVPQASSLQLFNQLDNMPHMKKQLEERTHAIENNIQQLFDELWKIQQELQRMQEQSMQMLVQKGAVNMTALQVAPQVAQGTPLLNMHDPMLSADPLQTTLQQQQHMVQQQNTELAQAPLAASLYDTVMIPQQNPADVLQIAGGLLSNNTIVNTPTLATFAEDYATQIRFPDVCQLLTELVTGQMACEAVMVPSTMFMGQVVTAFAPQPDPAQTISIGQQPTQQPEQQGLQILQGSQLILPAAAFPFQPEGAFATTANLPKPD
ncbi:circadian locomoter output cycles protein kaput isoform X2 [Stigmatopora argus]